MCRPHLTILAASLIGSLGAVQSVGAQAQAGSARSSGNDVIAAERALWEQIKADPDLELLDRAHFVRLCREGDTQLRLTSGSSEEEHQFSRCGDRHRAARSSSTHASVRSMPAEKPLEV